MISVADETHAASPAFLKSLIAPQMWLPRHNVGLMWIANTSRALSTLFIFNTWLGIDFLIGFLNKFGSLKKMVEKHCTSQMGKQLVSEVLPHS